jgi:hypothetical protein
MVPGKAGGVGQGATNAECLLAADPHQVPGGATGLAFEDEPEAGAQELPVVGNEDRTGH